MLNLTPDKHLFLLDLLITNYTGIENPTFVCAEYFRGGNCGVLISGIYTKNTEQETKLRDYIGNFVFLYLSARFVSSQPFHKLCYLLFSSVSLCFVSVPYDRVTQYAVYNSIIFGSYIILISYCLEYTSYICSLRTLAVKNRVL